MSGQVVLSEVPQNFGGEDVDRRQNLVHALARVLLDRSAYEEQDALVRELSELESKLYAAQRELAAEQAHSRQLETELSTFSSEAATSALEQRILSAIAGSIPTMDPSEPNVHVVQAFNANMQHELVKAHRMIAELEAKLDSTTAALVEARASERHARSVAAVTTGHLHVIARSRSREGLVVPPQDTIGDLVRQPSSGSAGASGSPQRAMSNHYGAFGTNNSSGAAVAAALGSAPAGVRTVSAGPPAGQRWPLGLEVRDDMVGSDMCLRVACVVPGGRADVAGVKAGDQIVRWNNTRVASKAAFKAALAESSHPGVRHTGFLDRTPRTFATAPVPLLRIRYNRLPSLRLLPRPSTAVAIACHPRPRHGATHIPPGRQCRRIQHHNVSEYHNVRDQSALVLCAPLRSPYLIHSCMFTRFLVGCFVSPK